jgi:hypothetical protein
VLPESVIAMVERLLLTDMVRISRPGRPVLDVATGQLVPGAGGRGL